MMRRVADFDFQLLVKRLEKRVRALEEAVVGSLGKGARAGSPVSVSCARCVLLTRCATPAMRDGLR